MEPKINYRLHKTPLLNPNLCQIYPGRIYIPSICILSPHLGYSSGPAARATHTCTVHITALHKITRTWLNAEKLGLYWEANSSSPNRDIFCTWWNSKAHCSFSRQHSVKQERQGMHVGKMRSHRKRKSTTCTVCTVELQSLSTFSVAQK